MQEQKVKEVGVHPKLGIGSVPLGDKVNELCRVISLLLAERNDPLLIWQRSLSEISLEKIIDRRNKEKENT